MEGALEAVWANLPVIAGVLAGAAGWILRPWISLPLHTAPVHTSLLAKVSKQRNQSINQPIKEILARQLPSKQAFALPPITLHYPNLLEHLRKSKNGVWNLLWQKICSSFYISQPCAELISLTFILQDDIGFEEISSAA